MPKPFHRAALAGFLALSACAGLVGLSACAGPPAPRETFHRLDIPAFAQPFATPPLPGVLTVDRVEAEGVLAGVRVVAAYPGGSPDLPSSHDRVAGYTRELKEKYGVEIVDAASG